VITNVESGFFDRNNERWTYLIFFVKNNNQNAISHMTFTLPTSGGCAPTYLNTAVTGWARGAYSTSKPTSPITNSLTMVYGRDNSCSVTRQTDVLKISSGANDADKTTGIWVRLELKGTWEFADDATVNFKYGNDCCTQALRTSGGGSGIFGCYWDCALDVKANFTNILCFGGSTTVTVDVTGAAANPPLKYKLDNGPEQTSNVFTNVLAGQHTILVKQGPCEGSVTFTVTQPSSAVDLDLTHTDALCNGASSGSITATGKGGTPPYQYRLGDAGGFASNNVFNNLAAGTYTVYVKDNNGCIKYDYETVEQPRPLDLTLTATDLLCKGNEAGSITAVASGGTQPYQYKLLGNYGPSGVFGGVSAGTYTVYVKDDNGCEYGERVEVKEPAEYLTAESKADKEKVCTDEKTNVTITAKGGTPPYKYQYDNGTPGDDNVFSLGAGTHNFTVIDKNGCTATTSVTILSEVCGNFCTYTQGYFGNDEGLTTDGGGNASYKDGEKCISSRVAKTIEFALQSGSLPEKVGNIELGGLTATQIINFLPGGGPSVLYNETKLPTTTSKNALLAQLLTLALNMGLNPDLAEFKMPSSGELWTQKAADCGSGSTTSSCTKYSFSAGKGLTVKEIFDAASYALVNGSVNNSERSRWTTTLDAINRGFDECARTCVPTVEPTLLLTGLIQSERPTATATSRTLKVKAYPNPFTDRIFINFTSPVAGKAVVEIFDMSGRRLAEINKGLVNAFAENKVEYMVPTSARSAIIYKVTVGSYSITGRMIAPTR
jgi:hypothetical protein